jgi:hypothetical protein
VLAALEALTLAMLFLGACHLPAEPQEHRVELPAIPPPTAPDGAASQITPPPAEAADPLRDSRERHIQRVRQLTSGGRVAYPTFSADGQSLVYLRARAGAVGLERYDLVSRKAQALPSISGNPIAIGGVASGMPCVAMAPASCKLELLPELWTVLQCRAIESTPVPPAVGDCPLPKPRVPCLPCALGAKGERACPVFSASGTTLELYPKGDGLVRPLGQGRGSDFAPAFSSDGTLLVWLSTRPFREIDAESPLTRLFVLEVAVLPTSPRAIGPDQVHNVDPTWFPGKQRVLFASTADDAGGRDYDLFAIDADGNNLVRLTFSPGTDRFPAVSPDGKQIAWVSERNYSATGDQDLFVGDWVE